MPFQPERARTSTLRLVAIAVLLAVLVLVYIWSLRAGRDRAREAPVPGGDAPSTVGPAGVP